jgi:hypothetical protein
MQTHGETAPSIVGLLGIHALDRTAIAVQRLEAGLHFGGRALTALTPRALM